MCGRFTLITDKQTLAGEFKIPLSDLAKLAPRYNIAPRQPVAVLVDREGPRLDHMNWGLIPSWASDPVIGERLINARKETLAEKPSFRGPLKNSRCLVLADGFYEWEKGSRTPYYFRLTSRRPFGFAGLWSEWSSPDGSVIRSCTIITGEPNPLVAGVHNRMPMILPAHARSAWLDRRNCDAGRLLELLGPYPEEEMEAYAVSKAVNSPAFDDPSCIEDVRCHDPQKN